jgi:Fic family protein
VLRGGRTAIGDVLLCSIGEKPELEARNGLAQIDYLTYLVVAMGARELRESHILELQKLAIDGIYPCGGEYVDAATDRTISDGDHKPPHVAHIKNLVTECVDRVNSDRASGRHEIECAAYAMWRINWIHPFRGGNGRTARMVAYLIICMALGHMLPGIPSIPKLIEMRRDDYLAALRAVDASVKREVKDDEPELEPDITSMVDFLRPLVEAQAEAGVSEGESI